MRVLGAISGTSMDGIDIAVLDTDGRDYVARIAGRTMPYPAGLQGMLKTFLADPFLAEHDPLTALDDAVTTAFTEAIENFLAEEGMQVSSLDLIGLHGQTVWHRPERRFTRQLGQGCVMAERFHVDTIDAFRQADVASGGHGAPFAPLYHAALVRTLPQPITVLNLGGVGNVTYIDGDTVIAFDTGPASAMIDDYVARRFGLDYDADGAIAARGTPRQDIVARFMTNPFFDLAPPKSLDRQDFHAVMGEIEDIADPTDAVATLSALTVGATAAAARHFPSEPTRWLVCGGGRHNRYFLDQLRSALAVPIEPVESVGWNGDLVEAECFAYLAVRALDGLPLSLPTTTGVPRPMPGGVLHRAKLRHANRPAIVQSVAERQSVGQDSGGVDRA